MFKVGSCVVIRYTNGAIYQVQYTELDRLHWQCLEGPDKGRQAEESYTRKEIAPGVWQVNWTETDGIVVVQVVQLKQGVISTTIVIPGETPAQPIVLILDGTVQAMA